MVITPAGFVSIRHEGEIYRLAHLRPSRLTISGAHKEGGDLTVRIEFYSHVFAVAEGEGDTGFVFEDEGGKRRELCTERYGWALGLPEIVRSLIESNGAAWIAVDRNSKNHYAVCEPPLADGDRYILYFDLYPSPSDKEHVNFRVKSAYVRELKAGRTGKRQKVKSLIKKCHFEGVELPQ